MAIYETYSKRQKKLRGKIDDVFIYNDIPRPLRQQIIYIWYDTLGDEDMYWRDSYVENIYHYIVKQLRREYGVRVLAGDILFPCKHYIDELEKFFLSEDEVEKVLDAIELSFEIINRYVRTEINNGNSIADEAVEDLNERFMEHDIGYRFSDNQIIRIDSELIHSEVVKPALRILNKNEYDGAQQEFLKAHEHYRHGNAKEALNECLKSFESLMKSICDKRGWKYTEKGTARNLIATCMENKLIPPFWQQHFTSLQSLLESGVPTGRNKLSGHGQGASITEVPDYLVAYMLHMTASTLIFLDEAEIQLSSKHLIKFPES